MTEMKLTSQTVRSTRSPISLEAQVARVDAFVHDDARIGAQFPVELAGADIDGMTRAAPACSRQSVKPPVDAPISRQVWPVTSIAN